MMMTTRNDIKDRLIHNQSPFPTKDKVLSYTIPVDHTENLLFCSSSSSSSSSTSSSSGNNGSGQENVSLNFIGSDDDPCNGRDSLASFLDEGLGTSLDGVDEIASPIFPNLGRNDSGVFSSDEGNGVPSATAKTPSTHNHASLIPPTISSNGSNSANISASSSNNNNIISVAEVVSWKGGSPNSSGSSDCGSKGKVAAASARTVGPSGNILLSPPPPTATISVVTDSVTGIPSIICTSHTTTAQTPTPTPIATGSKAKSNVSSTASVTTPKSQPVKGGDSTGSGASTKTKEHHKSKSMPLGRQGPQKCTICDKVFSNASALTKHKLTHSDERRHACATCGKAFKRQDHLNGHMLTHRNKKPFECKSKGCGKSYCDARSLRRHVENRHGHEVLESMNLSSHKQGNKNSNGQGNSNNATSGGKDLQPEPQPELVQFTPIKVEAQETNNNDDQKLLDCMPVLQPEPQLESGASSPEKVSPSGRSLPLPLGPPVLQKVNESLPSSNTVNANSGIPVVVKRENVSVFDFDENMEDSVPTNMSFSSNLNGPTTTTVPNSMCVQQPPTPEKSPVFAPPAIKVSSIQGAFPDMRLIQELAKRFGDSKVALFLASPPTMPGSTGSSIAQIGSIQLDGQNASNTSATLASHAFLPTSESGLFSVTPISIVPTSSGEFTFKPATISMSSGMPEPPKPLYIVPSEPLLSTGVTPSHHQPPPPPVISIPAPPVAVPRKETPTTIPSKSKEGKSKSEIVKEKLKSGIGATLASRIKSKLKAGTLKRLGKAMENNKIGSESSPKLSHQSPANTVVSSPLGIESTMMTQTIQNPNGVMQTIQITAPGGGGTIGWCESPKDCIINGMEEDRLSEGGVDGDDKPVECSICSRRFKNTPALNGHMRLHGGYFKKETEGTKKKEVTKEHTHTTPLQTASVSVRALIEEKIKERRNNLLKLAAAAAAEKAANENGSSSSSSSSSPEAPSSQPQSAPTNLNKSAKTTTIEKKTTEANNNNLKLSNCSPAPAVLAQQQLLQSQKNQMENLKLKVEAPPTCSEKDRNCDQPTIINNLSINNNSSSNSSAPVNSSNNNLIISTNNVTNNNAAISSSSSLGLDPSFSDLSIFIGDGGIVGLGMGANGTGQAGQQSDLLLPPTTTRDPLLNHNQYQNSTTTSIAGGNGSYPLQVDKSNFTFLDCGVSPEDLCQAFHLIYVDGVGGNGTDLVNDQDMIGKVAKLPLSEISSLSTNDNQICQSKSIVDSLMCPPSQETCNLPWEWRNSISSDNTDSGSLSNVQDCMSSFLCSSASDTPDDSCTKDPVAGGGYCYTPILSPNSSFCLTPGPDSPFEAGPGNQSLSFICPSPSIGSSSVFSDPSVSSIMNPPSPVEPIFSPEQHSQPPSVAPQVNITPTPELPKYSQLQQQHIQGQREIESIFANGLDNFNQNQSKQGFISISQITPTSIQQSQSNNNSLQESMDCLPAFSTLPTSLNDMSMSQCNLHDGNFIVPKDIVVHCPVNMNSIQIQPSSMVPFEVFATSPLPKKVSEKWLNGKVKKHGKIKTGGDHQAEIPAFRGNKARLKSYKTGEEKLWDPCVLDKCSYEEVDKYLEFACCSAVPGGGMNKEYALHLLTFSKGNIREALLRLMEKLPSLPAKLRNYAYTENQRWSSEEIMVFQISLIQVGKDFARISKAIGTKQEKECVSFYYFWKKVCPNEYQVMKQIWKDRLDHQIQQEQQSNPHQQNNVFIANNNGTLSSNNNVSFLVPAQEFRSISICK